jgi:hypothetical protein
MPAGNGTRYRVLLGANDTGGEYFSVEVLMRKEAYGAVRGGARAQQGKELSSLICIRICVWGC